jgi:hypothetical protein
MFRLIFLVVEMLLFDNSVLNMYQLNTPLNFHINLFNYFILFIPFLYQPGYHPETPISARDAVEDLYGSRDDSRDDVEKVMF